MENNSNDSEVYALVTGPHANPRYPNNKFVTITTYDALGKKLNQTTLAYDKYVKEYDEGKHRYLKPAGKIRKNVDLPGYNLVQVKCSCCDRTYIPIMIDDSQKLSFCSRGCKKKYIRMNKSDTLMRTNVIYKDQEVINITDSNNHLYYIIKNKLDNDDEHYFINASDTTLVFDEDNNGIRFAYIRFNKSKASRIKPYSRYTDGVFWITDTGLIVSNRTKKVLILNTNKKGYYVHTSRLNGRDGVTISLKPHRLVAETYIPNPDNKPFVNHINGIKTHNYVSNLEWVTASENSKHAYGMGLTKPPVNRHGKNHAKLNMDKAIAIRDLYATGKYTHKKLSELHGIERSAITNVINNKTYVQ